MRSPEQRVVVEDLKPATPLHIRSTAVKLGGTALWVSTVKIAPDNPEIAQIQTAVMKIKGVKKQGIEGREAQLDSGELPSVDAFYRWFSLEEEPEARDYHSRVINRVADILEEDPKVLDLIQRPFED